MQREYLTVTNIMGPLVIVEKIDDENEKALVKVAEDELAMAIGDGGENVSLAGELTGYQIKVEPKEEVSKNDNE